MKYQCQDCKEPFLHAARMSIHTFSQPHLNNSIICGASIIQETPVELYTTDITVCPFCHSLNISEFIEPVVPEQKTVGVLVIDLVPGDNIALNKALADGYEIVGRYAKQYTLEKKQPIKTEDKQNV